MHELCWLRRLLGIAMCSLSLASCGGGGGASGDSIASPTPAQTSTPTPTPTSVPTLVDATAPAARESPAAYTVESIVPDANSSGEALAVNARGDVAGQVDGAAFIWYEGHLTTFPGIQYFYLDGPYTSVATAINRDGVAAGHDGSYHPCSMSGLEFATAVVFHHGVMDFVDRARDGLCSFEVDGINDRGVIVGESAYRGFVRYPDGHEIVVQPLSTRPTNNGTRASAIDNEGHVVGGTTVNVKVSHDDIDAYVIHAFLATFANDHQQMSDLGALPGYPDTYATAINEDLTIVGYSGTESGPKWTRVTGDSHAWVWQHGHMSDLGARKGESSFAYGVNDASIVVGCSGTDAVRWVNKRLQDLNDLIDRKSEWHLTCARAINRQGIIVGTGIYEDKQLPFRLVPRAGSGSQR